MSVAHCPLKTGQTMRKVHGLQKAASDLPLFRLALLTSLLECAYSTSYVLRYPHLNQKCQQEIALGSFSPEDDLLYWVLESQLHSVKRSRFPPLLGVAGLSRLWLIPRLYEQCS